jgi:hypothetical protein
MRARVAVSAWFEARRPYARGFAAGVVRGEHLTMRGWEYAARVGVQ